MIFLGFPLNFNAPFYLFLFLFKEKRAFSAVAVVVADDAVIARALVQLVVEVTSSLPWAAIRYLHSCPTIREV